MEKLIKVIFTCSFLWLLSACSSLPTELPRKYELTTLDQVEWFYAGSRNDVNKTAFVDEQSVTVETFRADYLLILEQPVVRSSLCHYTDINIRLVEAGKIRAGHDRVACKSERPVSIDRIYKFENKAQKDQIVAQLKF